MALELLSHSQSERFYSLQPSIKGLPRRFWKSANVMKTTSLSMETLDQSPSLNSRAHAFFDDL